MTFVRGYRFPGGVEYKWAARFEIAFLLQYASMSIFAKALPAVITVEERLKKNVALGNALILVELN